MHFAHSFPWWLALVCLAAIAAYAWFVYRRTLAPLTLVQRSVLLMLRTLSLAAIVVFLFRPIVFLPPAGTRDAIVPVLVDVSRSMRIPDADGQPRLARAVDLLQTGLLPSLSRTLRPELYSFGDGVAATNLEKLSADARRSDLTAALTAIRERYRGQRVAGIVVLTDGGDTGRQAAAAGDDGAGPPIFAVGIGSADGLRDREVLGVTAGEQQLDQTSIDLHVSAVSHGFGRAPFELRLLANGRVLETRRLVPSGDGSPMDALFTVFPDPQAPSVYTAEIAGDESEAVSENNRRSLLVSPSGRKRRVLVVAGAPGFEHSFMTRAWSHDSSLESDVVTRKGKNDAGQDTFAVQAAASRAPTLLTGFPSKREELFAYDALVLVNVEADDFTRAQLTMAAEFVGERGGGLLVTGGRAFAKRGLSGTPLEEVLPVELDDRRAGLSRAVLGDRDAPQNKLVVTAEGDTHPVMRIGRTPDESRRLWAALPPLASNALLGGPRPGATLLAVTTVAGGAAYPLVAVQRYGRGRAMVFGGEASWRWRMLMPSGDRSYDFFWRQAVRWLSAGAADPVALTVPDAPEPGEAIAIDVDARDQSFAPVAGAVVEASVTAPGGAAEPLNVRPAGAVAGRSAGVFHAEQPGLYRVRADARHGSTKLGAAERWMLVGGTDRELADPRLNEPLLRRLARASGGRYVRAAEASSVVSALTAAVPQQEAPEQRDLWHEPWAFALLVLFLCAEWILRRAWGLR